MNFKRVLTFLCAMVIGTAVPCGPVWAIAPLSEPPANEGAAADVSNDQGDEAIKPTPTDQEVQPQVTVTPDPAKKPIVVIEETSGK